MIKVIKRPEGLFFFHFIPFRTDSELSFGVCTLNQWRSVKCNTMSSVFRLIKQSMFECDSVV